MIQKIPTKAERDALNEKLDAMEQELLAEFGKSWTDILAEVQKHNDDILSNPQ